MNVNKITVVINTYNEKSNIEECIENARLLTNDIIVVDSGSTDKTIDMVKKMNVELKHFKRSFYVEPIRQFSIDQVHEGWILILDADERITQELAEEIKAVVNSENKVTHFRIPRKNIFAKKKWLKHGGWWPDGQIRLFEKKSFEIWPQKIHSTPVIKGALGYLNSPIKHFIHNDITSMVEKTTVFEDIESDLLFKANKSVKTSTFFRKFFGELNRRMFVKLGFLDGSVGVIESIYQAFSKTITYLYLYEKKNSRSL